LTALLLPVGMALAQSHGHSSGHSSHGAPAHTGGHASSGHWSGHPGGSFGGPHGSNAYHGSSAWHSDLNRHGDFQRHDFGNRGLAYRYPYYRNGRGFYPYAGYPFGGYGYAGGYGYGGYPYSYYGDFSSWYPYGSSYPYDSGYGNPGYAYPDYGVAPSYPPADNGYGAQSDDGYGAAPSYTDSATSRATITAPPGANIWVEGVKIAWGSGPVHTFQTPPLNPDQQYRYRIRAVWTGPDGRTVDQSQEVVFSAGAGVAVRFPTAQAVPAPPQT